MMSFDRLPCWVIVALVSRIARHVQEHAHERDRSVVDEAIQIAEEAARGGYRITHAPELSKKVRQVSEVRKREGCQRAYIAAACAAEAASCVCLVDERQGLIRTAECTLRHVRELGMPKADVALEEELQQLVRQIDGLGDDTPAPSELLDFVRRQATHEGGHAIAAYLVGILFCEVRIIYDAEVEFVRNPVDNPGDILLEELPKFCLVYAAGAAAEDLCFDKRREWANLWDRECHSQCKGIDFEEDVHRILRHPGFSPEVLNRVASELEQKIVCHLRKW